MADNEPHLERISAIKTPLSLIDVFVDFDVEEVKLHFSNWIKLDLPRHVAIEIAERILLAAKMLPEEQ